MKGAERMDDTQECIQLAFISHWEWCSGLMDEVVSDRWCTIHVEIFRKAQKNLENRKHRLEASNNDVMMHWD
jgi:hypothetical protein